MNHFGIRKVVTAALRPDRHRRRPVAADDAALAADGALGRRIGVGTGMTALVLGATVASRWFEKRRGLVVGTDDGQQRHRPADLPAAARELAENIGWRAALTFVVFDPRRGLRARGAVPARSSGRCRPAGLWQAPTITPVPQTSRRLIELLTTPLLTLRDVAKTRVFWVLFATFFVCGFSTNGLIQQHWISICGDVGIAPIGAAGYLALIGAFDFVGTIVSGWLTDRYDNRYLLLAYYGLRGLSLLFLPYSGFSLLTLTGFAVFYGLDWVATVPPTVKLTAQRFGAEKAGLVFGWVFAGHQLGAATAAFFAGAVRTGTELVLSGDPAGRRLLRVRRGADPDDQHARRGCRPFPSRRPRKKRDRRPARGGGQRPGSRPVD